MKPTAWYCPKCKKFDLADVKRAMASPEHVPHRGVDIGNCTGEMIPLYASQPNKSTGQAEVCPFCDKMAIDKMGR